MVKRLSSIGDFLDNTEIELKYKVFNKETHNLILEDEFISSLILKNSRKTLNMKGVYFDTEDFYLQI